MRTVLRILLVACIFLLLVIGYFHTITAMSQDLGRHFLTGKIIFETARVPTVNLYSYAFANFPFINHHWLSEVVFYLIYQHVGFRGLQITTVALVLAAFASIFFFAQKRSGIIAVAAVSLLYLRILFERTDIRPELFSFLFLSLFIVLLYRHRERFTRWIFIIPVLELLWVNMHIYFAIGILVIFLFLIDNIAADYKKVMTALKKRHSLPHHTLSLIVILSFSLLVTLFNPNSIHGATYPLRVFHNYGYPIAENQNIKYLWENFKMPLIPYFVVSSLLLFTSLLLCVKKSRLIDWLLATVFTTIAALAIRNFPLFVFATFIPAAYSFSQVLRAIAKTKRNFQKTALRNTVVFILLIVSLWQVSVVASKKTLGFGVETGAKNAADFFLANNLKGPLFNNFDIGSYLEYRIFPKEKVFVDGRPEAYPAEFFTKTYMPIQRDPPLFEKVEKKYNFQTVFFSHTDQTPWAGSFLPYILTRSDWQPVYLDDTVIIVVKDTEENKRVIKKFAMKKENLRIAHYNPADPKSLLRLASFFQKIRSPHHEVKIYQDLLALQPDFCPALYNLAVLYTEEKNPAAVVYTQKYTNSCQ